MQQADYTSVIGPLHECKKVCPCTKALLPAGFPYSQPEILEKFPLNYRFYV